jgi:hypothetical protein
MKRCLVLLLALAACGSSPVSAVTSEERPDEETPVFGETSSKPAELCDGKLEGRREELKVVRSSWQFHPGTSFTDFNGVPGYPCKAFDFARAPAMTDLTWTNAPSGKSIAFSEASTFCASPPNPTYSKGQFRYFRALVWIPKAGTTKDLTLRAEGIDDSLQVVVHNSKGSSTVVCQGNGSLSVDLAPHLAAGEINAVLLAHADLNCAVSALTSVDLLSEGAPVDIVGCPGAKDVPVK